MTGESEIVDVKGASELTGFAVATLYKMRCQGTGPVSFRLRGRVRYYRTDISAWIAEQAGRSNVTSIRRAV